MFPGREDGKCAEHREPYLLFHSSISQPGQSVFCFVFAFAAFHYEHRLPYCRFRVSISIMASQIQLGRYDGFILLCNHNMECVGYDIHYFCASGAACVGVIEGCR